MCRDIVGRERPTEAAAPATPPAAEKKASLLHALSWPRRSGSEGASVEKEKEKERKGQKTAGEGAANVEVMAGHAPGSEAEGPAKAGGEPMVSPFKAASRTPLAAEPSGPVSPSGTAPAAYSGEVRRFSGRTVHCARTSNAFSIHFEIL